MPTGVYLRTEYHKEILSENGKGNLGVPRKVVKNREEWLELQRQKIGIGDRNINWKGDRVTYSPLHKWVRRCLGNLKECVYCGNTGETGKIELASISHKAKRDLTDYIPLCVKCHREYDKQGRNFGDKKTKKSS